MYHSGQMRDDDVFRGRGRQGRNGIVRERKTADRNTRRCKARHEENEGERRWADVEPVEEQVEDEGEDEELTGSWFR